MATKECQTNYFTIQQGIFQRDILSPLLFLVANYLPHKFPRHRGLSVTEGYQLQLQFPESEGLPPPDAHVYILWDEESSEEPQGWYLCQILEYYCNGLTKVEYLDSSVTEILNLKSTPWHFTRKSAKKLFLPPEVTSPEFPLK